MTEGLRWVDEELLRLEEQGLRRFRRLRSTPQKAEFGFDGRQVINFGSNDYLGLSCHPEVVAAAGEAIHRFGWGSGASPLVCGYTHVHAQLEAALAHFQGTEAALVFGSGYAANVGTIVSLVGPGDVVYMDPANHASLWDGSRLSRADIRLYDHTNLSTLRRELQKRNRYRRALIVADSVFSIEGDLAPLPELVHLAEAHDASLLVDEAHALGLFGPQGEGIVAEYGLADRVPLRIGTLSKALGGVGGFLAGPQRVVDLAVCRARSYIFSTALPPAAAAAALKALSLLPSKLPSAYRLREVARNLREALRQAGWEVSPSQSQIFALIVGQPQQAVRLSQLLLERGIFCPAMRPPTVPEGRSCLRISLTLAHTEEMIHKLLTALLELRPKV